MSCTETHFGRFKVVAKGIDEMKKYAAENDLENKLEFDEYATDKYYCYIDTDHGYEAIYVHGEWQLIKFINHIVTDDYFVSLTQVDEDTYDFATMFYNGGTCLSEVLSEELGNKSTK
jgi:hypothetical protein